VDCSQNFAGFITAPQCTVNSRIIKVAASGGLNGLNSFMFRISPIGNPISTSGNGAFYIKTYNTQGGVDYAVDSSSSSDSNLVFSRTQCTLPCRTCFNQQTTKCLTCYTNTMVTSSRYYNADLQQCVNACGLGYYQRELDLVCRTCTANCNVCDASLACTTCKSLFLLYLGTCVGSCSIGTYQSGTSCLPCAASCTECKTTPDNCISCLGKTTFLYNNLCVVSCPADLYQTNNQCMSCQKPCLLCTPSGPTSC
jgi:hypothetical protein